MMLEVISAPDSDLIDLATVKLHLSITDDDSDDMLSALISRASAVIVSYVGQPLLIGSYRETLETGGGQAMLALSRLPVTTVTSVEADGSELASGFRLNSDAGLLLRIDAAGRSRAWEAFAVVEVSYSAGYATCPPDIQAATLKLIEGDWTARGRDPGLRSIGIGSISLAYNDTSARDPMAAVRPVLDLYRQPVVG